ncbi:MAG TPA: molybdopterin oxidoreductase family protein [Acidimicrobiia bacterium]|nr:molybdopterin oxidoreductase family protein [Acidimicrobiia bacterium]
MAKRSIELRTCPLCEAMCGLELHVEEGRVALIRPDKDDVWSKGHICPKGTTLGHLHEDPDRVREPMIRDGDTWREATWDEAFARAEELIAGVLETHGRDAMSVYIGNPTAHAFSLSRYVGLFIALANLPVIYSAGTVDQWPKNVSSMLMYGGMWWIPAPDIARTQYWLVLGGNPQASQGSLLAHADVMGEIERIQDRGGKVVVVDPRRTGTADTADEWVPIVPGTDAAFLLALCNVLFDDGLTTLGGLDDFVIGFDAVREIAREFTPERVEATTRIPAATTRRIARDLAAAPHAAVYGRIGTCNQEFGTLASWLVDVVNIITGNFDTPGGSMFGKPVAWGVNSLPNPEWADGVSFGRWKSRVRGTPEVLGQVPVSCLGEEIATPGPGQIKGLVTIAGNPVISAPGAGVLDDALPMLECMISVDNYLNETTRHAHVIFPGHSSLEQPHFDDLIPMWQTRSTGNFSPPVFPRDDRPGEWEVLVRLAALLAGMTSADTDVPGIDDGYFMALCEMQGVDATHALSHYDPASPYGRGPLRMLDLQIRTGPFGDRYGDVPDGLTLQHFRDQPHGIDLGPMVPRVREIIATKSGKIELAPQYITADVTRLAARLDRADESLVLVSRRHLRSNNSWMHNVKVLVKGKDRCTLLVHPDDAKAAGVLDGALARVTSEAGEVEVPVEVTDEMMRGVVCLPHGWGHDKPGTRLSVAREHAGVNNNLLAPGRLIDPLSNNAIVNGIPVEIAPA